VKPNGEELEADANFRASHFKLLDPSAPLDKRWRVVISIPSLRKDDLPVGSTILCDHTVAARLLQRISSDRSGSLARTPAATQGPQKFL
jgi:hypothetical protein